jgi:hypothetical protein
MVRQMKYSDVMQGNDRRDARNAHFTTVFTRLALI